MNLYFRLMALLLQHLGPSRAQAAVTDEVITRFRVLPNDLDTNMHMNNGRYQTLMDLGRLDFMAKTGMMWPILRKGLLPVLGASQMTYLRPLLLWQRFELHTRLSFYDEKWFVMTQRFMANGRLAAQGQVRGIFRHGKNNVAPKEVMALAGRQAPEGLKASAEVAEWMANLDAQKKAYLAQTRQASA